MNKEMNILLIVEGKKTEPAFFEQFTKLYNLPVRIFPFETNIYSLYKRMKDFEFNCDIKDVLIPKNEEQKILLKQKFAYTYLIFDCDLHHAKKEEKGKEILEIFNANLSRLQEMADYFIDESDPTIGKLYINYPMMESYKDCDTFFDDNFATNYYPIDKLPCYKDHVGKRKLASKRCDKYTKDDYIQIAKNNIYKLNKIHTGNWSALSYDDFRNKSQCSTILEKEQAVVHNTKTLAVLNTSIFLYVDYFGNEGGHYSEICK